MNDPILHLNRWIARFEEMMENEESARDRRIADELLATYVGIRDELVSPYCDAVGRLVSVAKRVAVGKAGPEILHGPLQPFIELEAPKLVPDTEGRTLGLSDLEGER